MLKTKTKFIITFAILVFAMIIFNVNTVKATDITEEDLQTMLDLIPDEMSLDISELEYEESATVVEENVKTVWSNNSIDVSSIESQGTTITYYGSSIYTNEFYSATVWITNSSLNFSQSKAITLTYNNHDNYNSTDESYVQNLDIESLGYFEVSLGYEMSWENFSNIISTYYTDLVGDSSITVKADSSAGGSIGEFNIATGEGGTAIGIFKDGILYDIRYMGTEVAVPVITVSSSISDSELENYIINSIKTYYKDFGENITKIEEGTETLTRYTRKTKW